MTTEARTKWRLKGDWLKNCNCIASCPCDTAGVPYPGPGCEGVVAMRIAEGNFGDVDLTGSTFAVTVHFPGALHEGNGTVQPFIDQRATQAQRDALLQILSGQAGGTLFEILASIVTTVLEPQFLPLEFEFDKRQRRARLVIPGALETVTAPLTIPATGEEQRVIVQMPDGFEYKQMEVAQTAVLKGTGSIRFDHHNTHSSLAEVEQTDEGLRA